MISKKSLCGTGISVNSYNYRSKVSFLIDRKIRLVISHRQSLFPCSTGKEIERMNCSCYCVPPEDFWDHNSHGVIGGGKQWEETWEKNMRKASTWVRIEAYCLLSLTQPRACSGKVTLCEFGRRDCVSDQYIILGFRNVGLSLSSWLLEARTGRMDHIPLGHSVLSTE